MEETGALAGKVAVVTGAARNIGREIALALGGEGAAVLVNALSDGQAAETVAGEVTAAGGRGLAHLADVTDEAAANGMADAAVHAFGRIDILVCNAGIRRQHPFTEVSFAEWRDDVRGPPMAARRVAFRAFWGASAPLDDVPHRWRDASCPKDAKRRSHVPSYCDGGYYPPL